MIEGRFSAQHFHYKKTERRILTKYCSGRFCAVPIFLLFEAYVRPFCTYFDLNQVKVIRTRPERRFLRALRTLVAAPCFFCNDAQTHHYDLKAGSSSSPKIFATQIFFGNPIPQYLCGYCCFVYRPNPSQNALFQGAKQSQAGRLPQMW